MPRGRCHSSTRPTSSPQASSGPSVARKPQGFKVAPQTLRWLFPNGHYVLVKRFTAKEEKRRVVACVYDPVVGYDSVAFENHVTVIHRDHAPLQRSEAAGVADFLNSDLVDTYFRMFSGSTQVNATDLRRLSVPGYLRGASLDPVRLAGLTRHGSSSRLGRSHGHGRIGLDTRMPGAASELGLRPRTVQRAFGAAAAGAVGPKAPATRGRSPRPGCCERSTSWDGYAITGRPITSRTLARRSGGQDSPPVRAGPPGCREP